MPRATLYSQVDTTGPWPLDDGTKFIYERTGAGLFNCAFRSTREISTKGGYIFAWMMDALMVGIGVGFDTLGAGTCTIKEPEYTEELYTISDSREGWVKSVQILLDGFFFGKKIPIFDYSVIRGAGEEIKGFGGTASGYGPLKELHDSLKELYTSLIGKEIDSVSIVDTENLIGRCVVAGNVRRSAALALGQHDDMQYLTMKNDQENFTLIAGDQTIPSKPRLEWITHGMLNNHKRTESPVTFGLRTQELVAA